MSVEKLRKPVIVLKKKLENDICFIRLEEIFDYW